MALKEKKSDFKALKDWHIAHNEHDIHIKKGDSCNKIPEQFIANLITEGVLKKSAPQKGDS